MESSSQYDAKLDELWICQPAACDLGMMVHPMKSNIGMHSFRLVPVE